MNVSPISGVNYVTPMETDNNTPLVVEINKVMPVNNKQWFMQEAFMNDVINAFKNFGYTLLGNLAAANNAGSLLNVNSALNNFVLSLQSALNQADSINNPTAEEDNKETAGYNHFAADLALLASLNNSTSISGNPLLQSNYQELQSVLQPLTPAVTTTPTLSDFFNMMLNNLQKQINNQNNVGTSVSTSV